MKSSIEFEECLKDSPKFRSVNYYFVFAYFFSLCTNILPTYHKKIVHNFIVF